MTFGEALRSGSDAFAAAGLDTPWLDALVLLSACAGRDKAAVYASFTDPVPEEAASAFRRAMGRRLEGVPVSYILGRKEFYGLSFQVDPRVLVPRPDTETLVEAALEILERDPAVRRLHDLCTGTGCVALAVAASLPRGRRLGISASDLSGDALEVFRLNSRGILGRELPHYRSDLLASVPGVYDMITANPPYITRRETAAMKASGWPEPALALDGGEDGLDVFRRLAGEAVESLTENGYLLVEGADDQADTMGEILTERGFRDLRWVRDLAGRRRVTVGRRGSGYV